MQVRLFPNLVRPGVGQKPRSEGQRPLLPQHARHCPVLEAGSSLGFLVYPPLTPEESYSIEYAGEGRARRQCARLFVEAGAEKFRNMQSGCLVELPRQELIVRSAGGGRRVKG